jgi:tryptophan synthase beta chain
MIYDLPDTAGHFGPYGGVFVAETLIGALDELKEAYASAQRDPQFLAEFDYELRHYVGRPSPVYHARRWSELLGGAQIYLKREDLNHTGAHKINNCIGQALLARRMRQAARHCRNRRRSARRGDGHRGRALWHGVRGLHGLRRHPAAGMANVYRMKLLGATVVPVN